MSNTSGSIAPFFSTLPQKTDRLHTFCTAFRRTFAIRWSNVFDGRGAWRTAKCGPALEKRSFAFDSPLSNNRRSNLRSLI